MPAPLWDLIFTNFLQCCKNLHFFVAIWDIFHNVWCRFSILNKKMDAQTAISNDGAIWDKFSEEHQHQGIKTSTIFNA